MINLDDLHVTHDVAAQRFELTVDGYRALIAYHCLPGVLSIDSTRVPPPIEGQGVAAKLTRAALDFARQENLAVVPACSYAAAFIRRNPEYQDLVAPRKG